MSGNTMLIIGIAALVAFIAIVGIRWNIRRNRMLALRKAACLHARNAKTNAENALKELPTDEKMTDQFSKAVETLPDELTVAERSLFQEFQRAALSVRNHHNFLVQQHDDLAKMTYEAGGYMIIAKEYDDIYSEAQRVTDEFDHLLEITRTSKYEYSPIGQAKRLGEIGKMIDQIEIRQRRNSNVVQRFDITALRTRVENIRNAYGDRTKLTESHYMIKDLDKELRDIWSQILDAENTRRRQRVMLPRNTGPAASESVPITKRSRPAPTKSTPRKRSGSGSNYGIGDNTDSGGNDSCGSD